MIIGENEEDFREACTAIGGEIDEGKEHGANFMECELPKNKLKIENDNLGHEGFTLTTQNSKVSVETLDSDSFDVELTKGNLVLDDVDGNQVILKP